MVDFVTTVESNRFFEQGGIVFFVKNPKPKLRYVSAQARTDEIANESILLLGDEILARVQDDGYTTSEQLLQRGAFNTNKIGRILERFESLTKGNYANNKATLDILKPFLELLSTGIYIVAPLRFFPTDGEGNFFWNAFSSIRTSKSSVHSYEGSGLPYFLFATQSPKQFDQNKLKLAETSFDTTFGLAYHLSGSIAALLDGHHRATKAAQKADSFSCITIIQGWYSYQPTTFSRKNEQFYFPGGISIKHERKLNNFFKELRKDNSYHQTQIISSNDFLGFKDAVEKLSTTEFPQQIEVGKYPTHDDIISLERVGSNITDEMIDEYWEKGVSDDYWYLGIEDIFQALIVLGDPRAKELAFRIARENRMRTGWLRAFLFLANYPDKQVEKLFIDYSVNDEHAYPQITELINDYFRRQS